MGGDAYEAMKREDRAGIAAVARKHTQKQGMEVSAFYISVKFEFRDGT